MKNSVISWCFSFVCMIFIICFSVITTVNFKGIYKSDIDRYHLDSYVGVDKETLIKNYDVLIEYQSIFFNGELELPDFPMSEEGKIHFAEVKVIFEIVQYICIISGITSITGLIYYIKKKEFFIFKKIAMVSFFVPLGIGIIAGIFFDQAFVLFHKVVFNNNYWIFDATTDPIISVLPQEFFMHSFFMIIGIIVFLSLLSYGVYRWLLNKEIENNNDKKEGINQLI